MSAVEAAAGTRRGGAVFDPEVTRREFPILDQKVHGKPLVYLDNGATSQKPSAVIEAMDAYYRRDNANVHRGIHELAERATRDYEGARAAVQRFLNAASAREVVFVRGTTEAVNLVAWSFVRPRLSAGDEVLISAMEHHANIVPWQLLCQATGAKLQVVPVSEAGELDLEQLKRLLGPRTRFLSLIHASNVLGTVNPVQEIVALAHAQGVPVLLDGAQAVPHFRVDVQELGCDFYAFSAHKLFGPTGIGALFGKLEHLEAMPPYQGGGEMIRSVTFEGTTYAPPPTRFEAGTLNIAGAVGLKAAIEYLEALPWEAIEAHERDLLEYATAALEAVPGLKILGTAADKVPLVSFVLEGVHPHDLGTILDREGVAIRAGHHCAQPLMQRYGVPATARASFAFYNTRADVDALEGALRHARELFGL